ncbi:DUF6894 family protein [Sphingomonas rhizophila]|uniref:DUF6894 family protein n=1 Tax=Sphingomonas rhizophila TaxID=2071607 RepID=UPI003CCDBC89
MPRYFFDISQRGNRSDDHEGILVRDEQAALEVAQYVAAQLTGRWNPTEVRVRNASGVVATIANPRIAKPASLSTSRPLSTQSGH